MSKKRQNEFLVLYKPYHEKFERFCRARVYGDFDFEDLMNETLLKAYEKFDGLRSKEAFFSFLCSIAVRILANNNRKKKVQEVVLKDADKNIRDNSQPIELKAEVEMLYQALALLPNEQRESIVLFEISGFSIKEIAEIQCASESSVKQRLRRGREKLRQLLSVSVQKTKEGKHE